MPGIYPKYDPTDKHIEEIAENELQDRIKMIDMALDYYHGNHHKPLKVIPNQRDDNIILNIVGSAIDKTVESIGIPTLTVEGGTDIVVSDDRNVETQTSPEQELLDALVDKSQLEQILPDTLTSGAIAGQVYWRIVIDQNEQGDYVISDDNLPYVMLLDPRMVQTFWDATNPRHVLFYRLQWGNGQEEYRQDIVPGWLITSNELAVPKDNWAILEYVKAKGKTKFEYFGGAIWEYPFAPIVSWKNRRKPHSYYGDSDLRDASLNDALNFVLTNTARIIKFHAHPRTIGTGMEIDDVAETAVDGFFTVMNENAKINNLEMQSDLQSSMQMISMLRNNLFAQMRVMDISGIKDRIGQVSNFGVRMMFHDMLQMIVDKRQRYGDYGIATAFQRMMFMAGVEINGITPEWDDPLPVDYRELVESLEKESNLGFTSKQTLARDLGRDFVKEQAQIDEERSLQVENSVNALTQLAQQGVF